jgi:PPM family protein phosphatase
VVAHCQQPVVRPAPLQPEVRYSAKTQHLVSAVRWANRKIRNAAAHPSRSGMGATLVAVWLNGDCLSVVNVGDSRAYLMRDGCFRQLTRDHSLAAERVRRGLTTEREATGSRCQNILLQALGVADKIEVEAEEVQMKRGDIVLLCTDGLTHMVDDRQIAITLAAGRDAQSFSDRLVALASAHGGHDNVTAVVLRLNAGNESNDGFLDRLRRRWSSAN